MLARFGRPVSRQTRKKISRALKSRKLIKNPRGGLTPYGIKTYNEKYGSNLQMGVMRKGKAMRSQDYRRKGSFLRRHYGGKMHPLRKPNGEPTRYALQARAWGEPAPTTPAAVQRLGRKGTTLLKRYQSQKKKNKDRRP